MAPLTSFINITRDLALPVRVMVNRKAILNNNILMEHTVPATSTHNNKAIVRLHKTSRIKLSNRDMRKLIDDIKEQILKICLETSIEELIDRFQKNASSKELDLNDSKLDKNKLVIPLTSPNGWKCLMVINIKSLENLRLSLVMHADTIQIPRSDRFSSGGAQLLVRNLEMKEKSSVVIREESDDEDAIPKDGDEILRKQGADDDDDLKKGNLIVSYRARRIVNRGVDLIVILRPSS